MRSKEWVRKRRSNFCTEIWLTIVGAYNICEWGRYTISKADDISVYVYWTWKL